MIRREAIGRGFGVHSPPRVVWRVAPGWLRSRPSNARNCFDVLGRLRCRCRFSRAKRGTTSAPGSGLLEGRRGEGVYDTGTRPRGPSARGNGVGVLFDGQRSRGGDRFRLRREDWLSYN